MKRRTPLKRSKTPLKRTSLKRRASTYTPEQVQQVRQEIEADWEFYLSIWKKKPHHCFETNQYLGEEPRTYMFHHVLEKRNYPQYRHTDWNIVLVTLQTHDQVGMDLDKCPKIKAYREFLIKTYLKPEPL